MKESGNQGEKTSVVKDNTLKSLLNLRYIWKYNKESGTEEYYMPEKDEDGNVIVDRKKKCVKFIDRGTGKEIIKYYETEE